MTKRMLIDASHAEETRVVVLDGSRLEDFDVETATKRQLKGNIYLAKVVRVEPSLQAAFVEYGGNRHGFLAFSEIHPDYYQIPVADRQRLLEMEADEARREEEEADLEMALDQAAGDAVEGGDPSGDDQRGPAATHADQDDADQGNAGEASLAAGHDDEAAGSPAYPQAHSHAQPLAIEPESLSGALEQAHLAPADDAAQAADGQPEAWAGTAGHEPGASSDEAAGQAKTGDAPREGASASEDEAFTGDANRTEIFVASVTGDAEAAVSDTDDADDDSDSGYRDHGDAIPESLPPETVGGEGDSTEDRGERRLPPRFLRNYKIQEVIRRRQILLVQVVKEERGTKGAALTTYLSLAGRFSVLMPNSPRGGGISRKITSATDRRRLKEVISELDIPRGMGLIVRTAGANRPKPEIKRDCEYLLRLWDDIRDHTMRSVAPALIYEEASLIKRAIRDLYSRDIDDIQVDGEDGWRAAHEFMRMLMPSHAKKVQLWRDAGQPLFARHQVESQLDSMLQPIVQLRSGGYLVINQAEALVAIDVNSGRSTRERGIEETALRTNLEAADEAARQLRLRDLAGLIVIDFIDMESKKHNAMVERRMKEALKNDRARIQVGHISHFGLLEMSRQRLRPSLAETSFISCPHCGGTGHVRSTESAAIFVMRGIEDEGSKRRAAEVVVHVATPIALYLLNHKRERLREIEHRYSMRVIIAADDSQLAAQYRIERLRAQIVSDLPVVTPDMPQPSFAPAPSYAATDESEAEDDDGLEDDDEAEDGQADGDAQTAAEDGQADGSGGDDADRRRRRRRRRRRGRREDAPMQAEGGDAPPATDEPGEHEAEAADPVVAERPDADEVVSEATVAETHAAETHIEGVPEHAEAFGADDDPRNRRRGRRGGRRRRRDSDDGELSPLAEPGAEQPDLLPIYAGPTPANPFGGQGFDIFDVLEQAERTADVRRPARATRSYEAQERQVVSDHGDTAGTNAAHASGETEAVTDGGTAANDAVAAEPAAVPAAADPEAGVAHGEQSAGDANGAPVMGTDPAVEEAVGQDAESASETVSPVEMESAVVAEAPVAAEPAVIHQITPASDANGAHGHAAGTDATPEVPEPANDATSEPAVKPIVIGSPGAEPSEKKRGWWRR
jgi:ribonuclease E